MMFFPSSSYVFVLPIHKIACKSCTVSTSLYFSNIKHAMDKKTIAAYKRTVIIAVIILFTLLMFATSCRQRDDSDVPPQHIHDFAVKSTSEQYLASDATCTSPTTYYYSCSCGNKTYNETLSSVDVDLNNQAGYASITEYVYIDRQNHSNNVVCSACKEIKSSTTEEHTNDSAGICTLCVGNTPGLYEAGSSTLIYSWKDLIANGILSSDGKVILGMEDILAGDLIISDDVTIIGNYAFYNCTSLTSITIPDSVTSINDHAFGNCINLTNITIPSSVTSIGENAFIYCDKLVEVYNLSSLNITKGSEDNGCVGRYALIIHKSADEPNSVFTDENGYVFYEKGDTCHLLGYKGTDTELTLPKNCNGKNYSIYKYAFYNCSSLTSITIPDSVTNIGNYSFFVCASLTSITIPNSVKSIGNYAFAGSGKITNIKIPDSVKNIGSDAFQNCSSLTSIVIPNSVTNISHGTFYGCSSLTSITIPDSVKSIGASAFWKCTSLSSVTIPNSVTKIGQIAFGECTGLTSIIIPDGVKSIDPRTFSGCTSLTSITIPDSVTSIGTSAFSGCTSLTSITIPDGVMSIGMYAFSGCGSLTSVEFKKVSGWKVGNTDITVNDTSTNATYLTITYSNEELSRT